MERSNRYLTAASAVLVVTGLMVTIISIPLFNMILGKLLDLTPGEVLYNEWTKPSPEMTFDVFIFNWTNPEDFTNISIKPSFSEIGPFRFDVKIERTNVTYHDKNDTLSYSMRRWYKFNREESVHDLDFQVTILNQLSAAAAYKSESMNYLMKKSISLSLSSLSSIKMTKSVGELLFDGFSDTLLNLFRKMSFDGSTIPDKFGFFYSKNGSSDGLFNIGIGRGDHKLGMLYSWNGMNYTKTYQKSCGSIQGASMDFYTDNIYEEKVHIFNPSLCRKFTLDYVGKSKVHGIDGLKFEIDDSFLDNGTKIPDNACFCGDQCVRYGAVPATLCRGKVNNYLTLPHFYKADPYFIQRIDGMKPIPREHNFHLVVEPTTGFLLKMKARLQLNIYVNPVSSISMFEHAPSALLPLMWFQHNMKIPEEGAFSLGILLSLKGLFITIGVILLILGILIYMLFVFELGKEKKFNSEDDGYHFSREMTPLSEKH